MSGAIDLTRLGKYDFPMNLSKALMVDWGSGFLVL